MSLSFLHYDVFTTEPLTGNQLAVFLDGRGLAPERMQALAREMNFSESTFILPPESAGTDVRTRIFTPATEMPMAGHPTIGSTFALAESGAIRPGMERFVFGLGVGPTPVDLEWHGPRLRFAWMTQQRPSFGEPVAARDMAVEALGLSAADLAPDLPVQQVSCGVPFLFVPLRSRDAVDRAVSDAAACRRLKMASGLDLPIFLFALDASVRGAGSGASGEHRAADPPTIYSRMFAPEFGIVEDPATGSASGPLGCYVVRHGLVQGAAARQIVSLQGVAMGRPSRIHISIAERAGEIVEVKVGGTAVLVGRGEIVI